MIVQKLKVATELWTAGNISSCGSMINVKILEIRKSFLMKHILMIKKLFIKIS